jgi:thiamine-phosphate diphosphorylase
MRPVIAGLYALTPDLLDTDELIARVRAAIAGGATAIQYRNKIASPPLQRAQALALRDLCAEPRVSFIVNDDVRLAYAVDADGGTSAATMRRSRVRDVSARPRLSALRVTTRWNAQRKR